MKINKISKKLIKPQTPTPPNLKNYHISFLDKYVGAAKVAILLFYKSKPDNDNRLEESLAKILVQFYMLAGRYIKKDLMVDCSDQGAEFVTAEALDVELIDLVGKIDQLNGLVPDQHLKADQGADDPILSIQITHFRCGGAAIAVNVPNRVFDAASLGTFITAWSDTTNPDKIVGFTPSFDLPSLFPKKFHILDMVMDKFSPNDSTLVYKRLVFNEAALTSLKSKIKPKSEGKTISGARVVTALISEALIRLDRAKRGRARDIVLFQAMNLRERTLPPQPKHSCGNFVITSLSPRAAAADIGVQGLFDLIGDSVRKSIADHADMLSPEKDGRDLITNNLKKVMKVFITTNTNVISFIDWSKFGFYEADFGWGKPFWVSTGPLRPAISTTLLMSNEKGDWMEAWVFLNQKDMLRFQEDEVIKSFSV